jgi:transposase
MAISDHKHMPEPVRRIEVFTGAGRRRNWSAEEKASIIAESYVEGETVSSVARRHSLTAQQLFTWRRLARQAPAELPTLFLPAVVEAVEPEALAVAPVRRVRRRSKSSGIELEIGGTIYVTSVRSTVALDARDCTVRWRDDYVPEQDEVMAVNRGVAV